MVKIARDPGTTPVSEKIRNILKDKNFSIDNKTEALLFSAARAQLVEDFIRPNLQAGHIVLCDRFVHSTLVYQGVAGGVCLKSLENLNNFSTGGLAPNLTFFLLLHPEEGLARKHGQDGHTLDRMETKNFEYHRLVAGGFKKMAENLAEDAVVINAALPIDEIHDIIKTNINKLFLKEDENAVRHRNSCHSKNKFV